MQFYLTYCARPEKWTSQHPTSDPWTLWMLPYVAKYVIKLRILKGDTYPGLSGWVPNVIACILVTGSLRDTHTEVKTHKRGRGNMMTEAEVGVRQPQVKECRQPPKSERGKECVLPRSPTGSTALPTPWFGFLASRSVENKFQSF